jgi:hypothetical protein
VAAIPADEVLTRFTALRLCSRSYLLNKWIAGRGRGFWVVVVVVAVVAVALIERIVVLYLRDQDSGHSIISVI